MKINITILRQHLTVITPNKQEMLRKLQTLINFSIRSGVAVIGQNRLEMSRFKNIDLVLLNGDISPNTERKIFGSLESQKIIKIEDGIDIGDLTGRKGIKVIGFTRSELQREINRLIKTHEGNLQ